MSLQNAAMYGRRARDSRSSEVLGDNVNRAIEQLNSAIEKLERRVRQLESKIAEKCKHPVSTAGGRPVVGLSERSAQLHGDQ
jgi:hypothetical protein